MRVILRKGHIGVNFYFIYSGSVFINVEETSSTGAKFVRTETVLHHGDSFGVSDVTLSRAILMRFLYVYVIYLQ